MGVKQNYLKISAPIPLNEGLSNGTTLSQIHPDG
jgi:hypothetical protein